MTSRAGFVVEDTTECRDRVAREIAARLARAVQHARMIEFRVGDRYVQAAPVHLAADSDDDGVDDDLAGFPDGFAVVRGVRAEVQSRVADPHAPGFALISAFDDAESQVLDELGFQPPESDDVPNWWIDAATDEEYLRAARAVVDALVDVCAIPLDVVHADIVPAQPRAEQPAQTFAPPVGEDNLVTDPSGVELDYGAFVLARRAELMADWPWRSDVDPAFLVLVDDFDRRTVLELVALAPTGPGHTGITWFRRTAHGWVADPTVPRRLRHNRGERLRSVSVEMARSLEPVLRF